ncbi:restriction endonuclease subunit S [Bacillus thuringiensis]|uniref:restriction endonuclease subunit S n=1 Tax=Bacillus thuringiensis TaxID=1428 RepID=UPI00301851EB
MVKLGDIFEIKNGYNISLFKTYEKKLGEDFIPYLRPTSNIENIVSCYVNKKDIDINLINPPNTLFVSTNGEGSHTYSYVISSEFVHSNNSVVLIPKKQITTEEKQYYALCITKNRFKFSYGRLPVGDRLRNIELPDKCPDWVYQKDTFDYEIYSKSKIQDSTPKLEVLKWRDFVYEELFEIKKGKRVTKKDIRLGKTPFIAAIDSNNGIREYCDLNPLHEGNVITVNYNGSGVAEAFYQNKPFWASDDVNVLYPRFKMNIYIAMFIITLIRKEKYRFSYGRKWHLERMKTSTIRLPIQDSNEPDWLFMENYIKTLKYSDNL